jgi:imidazolonepropionase-like amidohydrolase
MGTAACLRQTLIEAQNYREKMASTKEKGTEGFERNLKMEALLDVLAGKVPLRAHAHRADDIMTAIRIAEEFNLQYTIEHCTEGDKIAGYLAQKNVRAAVGPTLSSRSKLELKDMGWHTVVALNKAGVKTSITTDHPVIPVQYLTINAAMAVRAGLDEDEALKAITITAAEHLGMEDRLGSIEPGKDADLVIWSGDPFHYKSRVEMTFIDGKRVG